MLLLQGDDLVHRLESGLGVVVDEKPVDADEKPVTGSEKATAMEKGPATGAEAALLMATVGDALSAATQLSCAPPPASNASSASRSVASTDNPYSELDGDDALGEPRDAGVACVVGLRVLAGQGDLPAARVCRRLSRRGSGRGDAFASEVGRFRGAAAEC